MVRASKRGLMELNTLVSGAKTRRMGKENSFMWRETCMKDTGSMIKLMGSEFINTSMEPNIKENGSMIYNTEKV